MKLFSLRKLIPLLWLIVLTSCHDQLDQEMQGQLSFQITPAGESAGEGRIAVAAPAALKVSLEDLDGGSIYSMLEIPLIQFGEQFVTTPVSMPVGAYRLTEYLIIDGEGNTLYAAPKLGSEMAYLVSDPLPIEFSIATGLASKLSPEIVSLENLTPEDFGYVSYMLNILETLQLKMAVYVYQPLQLKYVMTTAQVNISPQGESAIYTQTIDPEITMITLPDAYANYTVSVTKSGYLPYSEDFTNAEMKSFFDTHLEVRL